MTQSKRGQWMRTSLYGGLAVWAISVISCTTVSRTIVAPPGVPGAEFVGSQECAECHEGVMTKFADSTHARLHVEGANAKDIGCEACHGPGSMHVQEGGTAFSIVNPGRESETCFKCHLDKRGEFNLPHAHPVASGDMSCSDCHDPHSGRASPGGAQFATVTDTCLTCHSAQRGPFVFEHEASREGCTACHNPHGTVSAKMLKSRNQTLCLQCHFQELTPAGGVLIGGRDHSSFIYRGTCWSAGCHEAVHGSHVSSSLRF